MCWSATTILYIYESLINVHLYVIFFELEPKNLYIKQPLYNPYLVGKTRMVHVVYSTGEQHGQRL